jgi:hypothetical protein
MRSKYFNPITREWATDPTFKEILILDRMLDDAGIPHTLDACNDGWRVCYPTNLNEPDFVMAVYEHFGSYGSWMDTLEITGLLTPIEDQLDFVAGFLDAEDVFNRIEKHWEENCLEDKEEAEGEDDDVYMTPEEFTDEMIRIRNECCNDVDVRCQAMQDLMCDLLVNLGYGEGIDIFLDLFSEEL